jgi:pimeloyl-ACP methyl ester carboxylesterase
LSGGAGPRTRFDAVARKLQKHPITVPEPAPAIRIGYAEFLSIFTVVLYRPEFWQLGAQLVADLEAGDGTVLADILRGFTDPINEPQIAILCSEAETVPAPGLVAAAARAAERRAPHFGRYWAYTGQVCASWPRLDQDRYRGPWNRRTSAPALLLTSRYDPATPFHNAVETNRILPGSRLLTVDGYGHTAAGTPSACARQAEQDYVIAGRLPAPGATCPIDTQPFSVNSPASASGAAVRALL